MIHKMSDVLCPTRVSYCTLETCVSYAILIWNWMEVHALPCHGTVPHQLPQYQLISIPEDTA